MSTDKIGFGPPSLISNEEYPTLSAVSTERLRHTSDCPKKTCYQFSQLLAGSVCSLKKFEHHTNLFVYSQYPGRFDVIQRGQPIA
ncbi:MAG: hypothetical protein CMJ19_12765 [Phycisphaeraceae bacterium]|nr:hypothetical protein [Phycisphaeraceae bacterium]